MKRRVLGLVACGLLAIFGSWSVTLSQDKASATKAKPQESKTQEVIAEGVGATADEAIKDAYRNAVRQVVGAVVDAETLVKNDELIDDKVLSYSDGFIKGYEEIAGSKKVVNGLHKIKIKAAVERRSVIAKLKAANVTVKDVDGKGLFAEAVTQLDAEKDSAALLAKAFAELPTLLTAEVVGKPEFDKEHSEIVANVVVQVDRKAYSAYVKRLEDVLAKVAVAKDSTLVKAEPVQYDGNGERTTPEGGFFNKNHPALGGPKLKSSKQWCIWVNNFNNATHTSLKWNGYVVESDPTAIVAALEVPTADDYEVSRQGRDQNSIEIHRPSEAKTVVTVAALDADGSLITEDENELVFGKDATYSTSYSSAGQLPFLRHMSPRSLAGEGWSLSFPTLVATLKHRSDQDTPLSINLYVSPYALAVKQTGYGWSIGYYPERRTTHRLKVTLEELKQVKQFKCEVTFKPDTAAASGSKSN